jgi:hypothetical protein
MISEPTCQQLAPHEYVLAQLVMCESPVLATALVPGLRAMHFWEHSLDLPFNKVGAAIFGIVA